VLRTHCADRPNSNDLTCSSVDGLPKERRSADARGQPCRLLLVMSMSGRRRFVMHPAYGRIGEVGVGGLEVIGYDPATGQYRTYFFDSQGNIITETLSYRDGTWTWQGEHARCTGVFSKDGKTLTAPHERSDDGKHWEPSMTVTLHKIE
jgi:hypothetical protein